MVDAVTLGALNRIIRNNSLGYKVSGGTIVNSPITSSTIDGSVIGGVTPAAATFTSAQASTGKFTTGLSTVAVSYTSAAESGTFAAGNLTSVNSPVVIFQSTTSTPGTVNTRTAAQMFADSAAFAGQVYLLRIYHSGTGTLTVGAGSNVTINGTATVSTSTWREWQVTLASTSSVTFQNLGAGTV